MPIALRDQNMVRAYPFLCVFVRRDSRNFSLFTLATFAGTVFVLDVLRAFAFGFALFVFFFAAFAFMLTAKLSRFVPEETSPSAAAFRTGAAMLNAAFAGSGIDN